MGPPSMSESPPVHDNVERLDSLFRQDTFARSIGVEILDWSGGTATVLAIPSAGQCNFAGSVHGGFLFSAADVALSIASNSWGRICVAASIDIHYLSAVNVGDQLEVVATEINRGRRLASYRLEIHRETKLLSTATGLTYRSSDWHLGAEAWSETWRSRY